MNPIKRFDQWCQNTHAGIITWAILLLIAFVIGSTLLITIGDNSRLAINNTSVQAVPGGTSLVGLWPLLFVILPLVFVAKRFSG